MTGLEKILKAIEEDADAKAKAVLAEAEKEAEKILTAAKQEAMKKCSEIAEKSDLDGKAVINRAESAAALQEKKILLNAKQQIISNVIDHARKSLTDLPDTEYIDIILRMVKKYAHNQSGKIVFNARDSKRLPQDFEGRLKQSLSGKPEAALAVSKEIIKIDGGFLLVYGDIEENCSFDALFGAARENLQDKVNSLLFE
jgi:V/A-type H+-transporting ATPase subunit E